MAHDWIISLYILSYIILNYIIYSMLHLYPFTHWQDTWVISIPWLLCIMLQWTWGCRQLLKKVLLKVRTTTLSLQQAFPGKPLHLIVHVIELPGAALKESISSLPIPMVALNFSLFSIFSIDWVFDTEFWIEERLNTLQKTPNKLFYMARGLESIF